MKKRFTDCDKWQGWYRELPVEVKCLWSYICDRCDNAGVWRVDRGLAEFSIGKKLNWEKIIKILGHRIHIFDDDKKWYITEFIEFQCGEYLSVNSYPHKQILELLKRYNLYNSVIGNDNKILDYPSNRVGTTLKEREEEKDKDIDKEKDKEKEEERAKKYWEDFWIKYPKKQGKKDAEDYFLGKTFNITEDKFNEIMVGLGKAIVSEEWQKKNGQYIPLPATFLRKERWRDELTPKKTITAQETYIPPDLTPEEQEASDEARHKACEEGKKELESTMTPRQIIENKKKLFNFLRSYGKIKEKEE